jgi:hypothetical protein
MKRLAVLFGIIAISVAYGTAFASAPSVRDMPDLRLTPSGSPKGGVSSFLDPTNLQAYDVFKFVKDYNSNTEDLTVSILNVEQYKPPKASAAAVCAVPDIEIVGALAETGMATMITNSTEAWVMVYGMSCPGWVKYTVRVDDVDTFPWKSQIHINDDCVVKYGTFTVDAPSITSGRLIGDLVSGASPVFTWVWTGDDLVTPALPITPATETIDVWAAYINDVSPTWDVNGNYLGLDKGQLDETDDSSGSVSVEGINYAIGTDGSMTLTSGGTISAGPWLVGILASKDTDTDAVRIMVAAGMLANTPQGGQDAEADYSETFDGLATGTIPEATDYELDTYGSSQPEGGGAAPGPTDGMLDPKCHWTYQMAGPTDTTVNSVELEIVDLLSDADLPDAAKPSLMSGSLVHIATGNALKAELVDTLATADDNDGFRLRSNLFVAAGNLGDVYTLSLNIATDAENATNCPQYQLFTSSALGGSIGGQDVRVIANNPISGLRPRLPLPLADDGWMTLSINYTPGATDLYQDMDGDDDFDGDDIALLYTYVFEPWGGVSGSETDHILAGVQMRTHGQVDQASVNVWIDNMRVYKSAFELDVMLGDLEPLELATSGHSALYDEMVTTWGLEQPTAYDSTFEDWVDGGGTTHDELLAVGWVTGGGAASPAAGFRIAQQEYLNADDSVFTIGAHDHTLNGGSSQSLKVILDGDDGDDGPLPGGAMDAIRAQAVTGMFACDGTGLYAMEAYATADGPFNQSASHRQPEVRILINEVGPNPFGQAAGMVYTQGGLPDDVDTLAVPENWQRVVATLFIPDADLVRGVLQIADTFAGDVGNFQVPVFLDDVNLYKVDDGTDFFDFELFDEATP